MAVIKPTYWYVGGSLAPYNCQVTNVNPYTKDSAPYNPLFNIDQTFIDNLQSISSVDMAKAVPYVSIKTVDKSGKVLEDLNLKFFQQPIDFEGLKVHDKRFKDRPVMSLKDLTIKTDNASGYLYYTLVTLGIKIHNPYMLTNESLIAFLVPDMPLLLEYGWNHPDKDSVMNKKETLLFAVKSYNINIDVTGQIDLIVEGVAFNDKFNNTLIGDEEGTVFKDAVGKDTIAETFEKLQEHIKHLQDLSSDKKSVNYKLAKDQAVTYEKMENKVRDGIGKIFDSRVKELEVLKIDSHPGKMHHPAVPAKPAKPPKDAVKGKPAWTESITCKVVTFHDLLYTLCNKTFANFSNLMVGGNKFKIVYGTLNKDAGKYATTSIAEFPINITDFHNKLSTQVGKGHIVLTVRALLNYLAQDCLENVEYWNNDLKVNKDGNVANFVMPHIVFNFTNNKEGTDQIVTLQILDINNGVPVTTTFMPDGVGPESAVEDALKAGPFKNIPRIRLGHAGSFIKNTSLTQISDSAMQATLIERMQRGKIDLLALPGQASVTKPVSPLILPLRGTMEVVGNIEWKPFRAFYLDVGVYLINAVYVILSVTHKLSHTGYSTSIDFIYH